MRDLEEAFGLVGRRHYYRSNNHLTAAFAACDLREILATKTDTPNCPDKTSETHLIWMLDQLIDLKVQGEKAHRWLGFVQGIMVSRGYITVDAERDRTRVIFTGFE